MKRTMAMMAARAKTYQPKGKRNRRMGPKRELSKSGRGARIGTRERERNGRMRRTMGQSFEAGRSAIS